ELDGDASEAEVREVFDFVEMDCDLSITPLSGDGPAEAAPAAAEAQSDASALARAASSELDIAALLASVGAGSTEAPAAVVAPVIAPPEPGARPPVVAKPAPAAPAPVQATPAAAAPVTVRVDLERVDRLINAVGELVIQQAMLAQRVTESGLARSSDIGLVLEDLEPLTREIQDSVMAIRAQPVKSVFQRMPRLVREAAEATGKKVKLVTSGEDTEVDKTVVERLAEPITHMLRNAIDHGLESPEDRLAAGKPAEGTVRLAALHRSGRIVIEIADDGKGINRPRVK